MANMRATVSGTSAESVLGLRGSCANTGISVASSFLHRACKTPATITANVTEQQLLILLFKLLKIKRTSQSKERLRHASSMKRRIESKLLMHSLHCAF